MWPRPYTQQQSQGRPARQQSSWGDSGRRPQRPQQGGFGGPQRGPGGFGQPQSADYARASQNDSYMGAAPSRGFGGSGYGGGYGPQPHGGDWGQTSQDGYGRRGDFGRRYQRPAPAPQWSQDEPQQSRWDSEPSYAPEPRWGRSYARPAPAPPAPDMSTPPNWVGTAQRGFRPMDASEAAPDYGRGQATLMSPDPSQGHPFSPFRQKSQQSQAPMSRGGGSMFSPDQASAMEAAARSQMDQFGGPATGISQLTQVEEPSDYGFGGYPTEPSRASFASRRYARPTYETPGFAS